MKLTVDSQAPKFTNTDQDGVIRTLNDYQGKWLLIYFYPKDFTSGCTKEACGLRNDFGQLSKIASIVGVSADSSKSHKKFAQKYNLPFALLADPQKTMINAYGADGFIFNKRTSFLINPNGTIVKIYEKVTPETHATEIFNDLKKNQT